MTEGNLVNAGGSDPLLTTIVTTDPVYIYFSVDERALQHFRKYRAERRAATSEPAPSTSESAPPIEIQFGLETDDGFPRKATIDFADNKVDQTTGTILCRATCHNPTGELTAGSRVRIRVPVSDARKVIVVPETAVLSDQDKKYVLAVDDKNVVQRRDIDPGELLQDGMRVLIPSESGKTKDLTPTDWIITQGIQSARINYPVEPVKTAEATTTQPSQTASVTQGQ
jgi:RND family efflux transporter MFP subunit